jgi:hypothetical protein
MVRGYLYMVRTTIYGLLLVPLTFLAVIGGLVLIRHIINDSLGGLYICVSQSMSPGVSIPFGGGVSGLLLQPVSTSVLLEVRSS